ncbi:gas vesicle protein [Candidatus Desulforudis audaxviator]|uniref:gas vesicle protein n=1 Tax=Candidatus Desulforudis audaxviator TaxID=471827 RepID=UPI00191E671F|nr:gas vesicle protein [Candidatus Desulforudis audaxviator]
MSQAIKPLEPTRIREATLNDLIDRILEKGLLLNADLIIGVAGIPLLGVNLRLALAGMSTMLRYGFMRDWDEATRAWESVQRLRGSTHKMEALKSSKSSCPLFSPELLPPISTGEHR